MKIYTVDFTPMYPVGGALIIAANSKKSAEKIASETITHTKEFAVSEIKIDKPKVIIYLSGDY